MVPVTKQDVQTAVNGVKNTLMQRMGTKQDIQAMFNVARDQVLNYVQQLHTQNQQLLRQGTYQNAQMLQQNAVLQNRVAMLEQELKIMHQQLVKIAGQPPRQIYMPAQPDASGAKQTVEYVYKPA